MSNAEKRHFFLAHLTLVMTTHKYFRSPAPALTLAEKYIGFRPRGRRPQMQNSNTSESSRIYDVNGRIRTGPLLPS